MGLTLCALIKYQKEHFTSNERQPWVPSDALAEGQCHRWCYTPLPGAEAGCSSQSLFPPSWVWSSDHWWHPVPWELLLTSSGWEVGSCCQWGDDWEPLWSGTEAWLKALPGLLALYETSQDLLSALHFFLVDVWLGGHLGVFTSWDLHLWAWRKVQMGRKPIAN